MGEPSVKSALLAALLGKHGTGTPIEEQDLLAIAAIDADDYATAAEVFEELRSAPYVTDYGDRGIELDTEAFGLLAEALYHECGWDPAETQRRPKHYVGWQSQQWS